MIEKILCNLRRGTSFEGACEAAGIARQTAYAWLKAADRGDERYYGFRDAILQAQGEAEELLVTLVRKAAEYRSWQAAAWLLERRFPARWSRRSEVALARESQLSPEEEKLIAEHRRWQKMTDEERRLKITAVEEQIRAL